MEKLNLDLLWTAVSCSRSCSWICCEQLWTAGEAVPGPALNCRRTVPRSALDNGELLDMQYVDLIVDSSQLIKKVYLYLKWTAMNWWRNFTCICCGQLWTDEKLYLYLLWTAVNWWEALPVSAVDSCATCVPCARPLELSTLHSSPCPGKTFPEIRSQVSLKPAGRDALKKTKVVGNRNIYYISHIFKIIREHFLLICIFRMSLSFS